ncbi:MAG TPA: aspartate/glutamate racemase family protein [Magnetospirillaceae bacterium]|nr:aspartate/glutamate racemase family protein [Magnetospirillaceae bacterium]
MKVIGLIGGMSWESSAEYYRLINRQVRDRLGSLNSARILMYSVDFGPIEQAQHEGRWDDMGEMLADAARRLQAGGADGVFLCTNTMHKVAGAIEAALSIPFIHIADPVGERAKARGWRKIGLLGTGFTMEDGSILRDRLTGRFGLEVITPPKEARATVHRVIYEELCAGVFKDDSLAAYREIVAGLAAEGAQAVVLGCTEISLLIRQEHTEVPLLDTTALHAEAAVEFALNH